MIRVVIDTNVFVSSFFGGNPRKIIDLWKNGSIVLCLSQEIIEEYLAVLNRLGLDNTKEISNLTRLFAEGYNSIFSAKTSKLEVVKEDVEDNKFLECAVALNSKIIVSGDKHLTSIRKYIDIVIMSPREFIECHNFRLNNDILN
jgi:putative PIN family toxin of toxin-antitoxin system